MKDPFVKYVHPADVLNLFEGSDIQGNDYLPVVMFTMKTGYLP